MVLKVFKPVAKEKNNQKYFSKIFIENNFPKIKLTKISGYMVLLKAFVWKIQYKVNVE